MSYNKVILMGNLTRDVESRALPSGSSVAQIGLAVNRKWKDGNSGELRDETTFIDCEAFGKTAENIAKFFAKGKPIFIEGRLKLDEWQDKQTGSKRTKLKVVVESFQFVGGEQRPAGKSADQSSTDDPFRVPAVSVKSSPKSARGFEPIGDNDIPF